MLKMSPQATPLFRGQIDTSVSSQQGSAVLYPGGSAAVFLGSVLTHAAVAGSMNSAKEQKQQETANGILEPYRDAIEKVTDQFLLTAATAEPQPFNRPLQVNSDINAHAAWVLDSAPVFEMAQDKRSISLQNQIAVYSRDDPSNVVYSNTVEIVSDPVAEPDPDVYWRRPGAISRLSANMFLQSIHLALGDIRARQQTGPEKTFSYYQGNTKRYERGQLVSEDCDRYTLKTLRGWILSVPISVDSQRSCDTAG